MNADATAITSKLQALRDAGAADLAEAIETLWPLTLAGLAQPSWTPALGTTHGKLRELLEEEIDEALVDPDATRARLKIEAPC